jgi:S-ribosylhomocysteine lyase LuxS involved in autoinducer biosynthesis
MGCRTGFYLTLFGHKEVSDLPDFRTVLQTIRKYKKVPFANLKTCGSAAEHDLSGAIRALECFVKNLQK